MTPQKKNTNEILYKLDADTTEDILLIAIKSNMPDFKIAYHFNRNLNLKFEKQRSEITVKSDHSIIHFRNFLYQDYKNHLIWRLIENKSCYSISNLEQTGPLFDDESDLFTSTDFLIQEWKTIDYFIIIENVDYLFNEDELLSKIEKVKNISTQFPVDFDSLSIKSQKNLIF